MIQLACATRPEPTAPSVANWLTAYPKQTNQCETYEPVEKQLKPSHQIILFSIKTHVGED